jgi:thiol-disulfide isomerase/thioredoxin
MKGVNALVLKRSGAYRRAAVGQTAWRVFILLACLAVFPGNSAAGQEPGGDSKGKRVSVYDSASGWKIRTLEGKEILFCDCKGKVVFLNFWATWCGPCIEEMPAIAKLYDSTNKDDVVFLLVSNENDDTVRRFLDKHRLPLPVYLGGDNVPTLFKTRKLPVTYIIDREGGVSFRCTGSATWDDPAYADLLRNLTKP